MIRRGASLAILIAGLLGCGERGCSSDSDGSLGKARQNAANDETGDEPGEPTNDEPTNHERTSDEPAKDEPTNDDVLAALEQPAQPKVAEGEPSTLEPAGCSRLGRAIRVVAEPGPASVAVHTDGFVIAAYSAGSGEERVTLVRIADDGPPMLLGTHRLDAAVPNRSSGPGLVASSSRIRIAVVDGKGALHLVEHPGRPGGAFDSALVASGVDPRFEPALREFGESTGVAYTKATAEGMRVELTAVSALRRVSPPKDITLDGLSGTAATFVDGSSPPKLVYIDARAGVSPIVQVVLDNAGKPGSRSVARPVSSPYEPPVLAAGVAGDRTWVAFTALGSAATTAVGLVALGDEKAPVPLLKGEGYGLLHVSAAVVGESVLFAMDAPTDSPPGSPRSVVLRRASSESMGPPAIVAQEVGPMPLADLAAHADGRVTAIYTSGDGVYAVRMRCD